MTNEKRMLYANALIELYDRMHLGEPDKARKLMEDASTVDAVGVVHAGWLDIQFNPMRRSMRATCSHCRIRGEVRVTSNECGFAVPDSDYCPHCGARMDLEA